MLPREQSRIPRPTRTPDWKKWLYSYVTEFLERCKLGLYLAFATWLYNLVFREALPRRFSEIFLVVVLLGGVPSGQPWGKVATLIRGLLEAISTGFPQDGS